MYSDHVTHILNTEGECSFSLMLVLECSVDWENLTCTASKFKAVLRNFVS